MKNQETRGRPLIPRLLHLAQSKGSTSEPPEPSSSSSDLALEKDGSLVAGGAASSSAQKLEFNTADREFMLGLARQAIISVVTGGTLPEVSEPLAKVCQRRACFVTLTKEGVLRGCVGNMQPRMPLYQAVLENARGAALRDPRFSPVAADELNRLRIEISVLAELQPLCFSSFEELVGQLHPHQDGVLLEVDGRLATFLPQVWDRIPDKGDFLCQLAKKAGCDPVVWRRKDISVSIYHVESFEEADSPLAKN